MPQEQPVTVSTSHWEYLSPEELEQLGIAGAVKRLTTINDQLKNIPPNHLELTGDWKIALTIEMRDQALAQIQRALGLDGDGEVRRPINGYRGELDALSDTSSHRSLPYEKDRGIIISTDHLLSLKEVPGITEDQYT
ncbi:MAG: hypothetical protein H6799_01885 [Candidatus Nomurabacteria bacterium]|nr:MAG: hypothetical protein H6799_01885 [Candidatus Nomurabacteria bacterium]HRV76290.1 hypothetical protein [Candidatus Saccharimonadales bacterium]